ncbi:hypothetical protein LTR95_009894, partial [Oleoguttula sp. CCFEE 5521]
MSTTATELVFLNVNQITKRPRRRMTEAEKLERRQRYLQSCARCTRQKRKCRHEPSTESWTDSDRELLQTRAVSHLNSLMGEALTISQPSGRKVPSLELPVTLLVRQPSSPYARAEAMVEHCIIWGGVADLWFSMVPATYGHDHRLDTTMFAIEAVCHYRQAFPGSSLAKCHATMAVALKALREAMTDEKERWSDFTLAAVAGLSPCEAVRTERAMLVTAHAKGLGTLLYERVGKVPLSRLSAAVFVYHISDDMLLSCLAGTASRLEQVQELYLTHDSLRWQGTPALILRHAGTRLSLALPRLVKCTRDARARGNDTKASTLACEVAKE